MTDIKHHHECNGYCRDGVHAMLTYGTHANVEAARSISEREASRFGYEVVDCRLAPEAPPVDVYVGDKPELAHRWREHMTGQGRAFKYAFLVIVRASTPDPQPHRPADARGMRGRTADGD